MKTKPSDRFLLWLRHIRKRAAYSADYRVWISAAFIGIFTALGVTLFVKAITLLTTISFGNGPEALASGVRDLTPLRAWMVPVTGGVLVSLLLYIARKYKWLPDSRCQGVAEIIEARAGPPGHVSFRTGVTNTLVSIIALGSGASAGREGPVVLMGGSIANGLSSRLGISGKDARTLLGCGAAAAVAASFNAPIAGVLFALEVVLGNYALSIFGPVALASLMATLVSRYDLFNGFAYIQNQHTFSIPAYGNSSPWDLLFAAAFGIICGIVAFTFMQTASSFQKWIKRYLARRNIDPVLLPPLAGIVMGVAAMFYPEVLGIGYEAITETLIGGYTIPLLTILLILKIFTTAICLSCRFGTGVFSPGLVFGAISGAAYGASLAYIFPGVAADATFYAMIGMGAVAGAILGAPISTTLIVFEMTGDYEMTVALMIAVGIATLIAQTTFGSSWFHWQLNQRGYDLSHGPQGVILQTIRVRDVMRHVAEGTAPLDENTPRLKPTHTLGEALAIMQHEHVETLPVADPREQSKIIGHLTQVKALEIYNKALVASHIEHHR
ncbi:MAG: chloride channel protein [bacterium]